MWWPIIMCASSILSHDCGLSGPVSGQPQLSKELCMKVALYGIELAGEDKARFKIVCAKSNAMED